MANPNIRSRFQRLRRSQSLGDFALGVAITSLTAVLIHSAAHARPYAYESPEGGGLSDLILQRASTYCAWRSVGRSHDYAVSSAIDVGPASVSDEVHRATAALIFKLCPQWVPTP